MKKRKVEIAVISDVHLGRLLCHADELLVYLSSIQPKRLILNGDILDIPPSPKRYFPPAHLNVLRKIITMASKGTEVFYITGNHDETLRRFAGTSIGNITIDHKLVLTLDGKKTWFFHGDIFDHLQTTTKWLVNLGDYGYRFLIRLNKYINWILKNLGKEKYSLAKKIKDNSKKGDRYIYDFEQAASKLAIENDYKYVVCGHIHHPKKELVETENGSCLYLNSGDWTENLTALEYSFKRWKLYRYREDRLLPFFMDEELKEMDINELIAQITFKNEKEREGEISDT